MNIVFTCGGTGGHINPAIAIANEWKLRHPEDNILFIGGKGHMEETLVPKAGYELKVLPAEGLSRKKNMEALRHNLHAAEDAASAVHKCKKILKEFGADIVVGTGGYASFPALKAASRLKIPTCVHEANAMPGLTTRLAASFVDKVLVCFPESTKYYRHPEKAEVTGLPVRSEFIYTKKEDARRELGLDDRPLIVSAFGSQGAKMMNQAMAGFMRLEQDAGFQYQHIHAIGSYGMSWMPDYIKAQGVDLEKADGIRTQEYIYNMPTVMAAADVIISRAGASSCNEIAASGTPCILIPSPNVTDNHQEKNARALADHGAATLVLEKDCTPERLMAEVKALLEDKEKYTSMQKSMQSMVILDSAQRLCDIMESLTLDRK